MVKHHGVHFLEKKQKKLIILENNSNDVRQFLGPPSTKNYFDNDIWVYIERKTTVSDVTSLGKRKILTNNVLVLEFDRRGILVKKQFYDIDKTPVSVCVSIDTKGKLFELDIWRVDFNPVVNYPDPNTIIL